VQLQILYLIIKETYLIADDSTSTEYHFNKEIAAKADELAKHG
jgi:hypothetical protein